MYGADYDLERDWGIVCDDELDKEMVFLGITMAVVVGILVGTAAVVGVAVFGGS